MAFDYRSPDRPSSPHDIFHDSSASYSASAHPRTSRSSSGERSSNSQQGQPVYEAVNNAFDKSGTANQLDPGLVAQITEEVRKQVIDTLKSTGQIPSQSMPSVKHPYSSEPSAASAATSYPPRDVYTPPSPTRHDSIYSTGGSCSPEPPAQDPYFKADARERDDPALKLGSTRATSSTASDHGSQYGSASQHSNASVHAQPPLRPQVKRHLTEIEETAIEKTWRPLFDADGQPTPRLSQFLRGLALHLIDDYEPKNTLVVTPAKMRKFYEDTRTLDEIYPWSTIFGTLSNSAISKMYRDLRCPHHLVQEKTDEAPDIPALTPAGFKTWMTLMIQGHPDIEFERLAKAVMNMPISSADDIKERFPKELPRRLFPRAENLQARQRCAAAICSSGKIAIRAPTFPPPPPTQPPPATQPPPYASYQAEARETAVASDSDNEPVAVPIERERKPYVAREGSGKRYEDFSSGSKTSSSATPVTAATCGSVPPDVDGSSRVRRTYSNASGGTSSIYRTTSNTEYPPNTAQTRQYRTGSNAHASRRRSPSFSSSNRNDGYGTRSEPNNVGDIPSSYYTSNIYSDPVDDSSAPRSSSRSHVDPKGHRNSAYVPGSQARHNSIYEDSDYYRSRANGGAAAAYGASAYGGYPPPPPRYT